MTEITPKPEALIKITSLVKQREGVDGETGQPLNFSDILAERLGDDQVQADEESASSGGLPELEASFAPRLSQAPGTIVPDLVQEISATLDQLDTYAQWLADPGKTLRQADELLGQIKDGIQGLAARSESESDTRIQGILDHLSTLVAVEKIKMDRGDYT